MVLANKSYEKHSIFLIIRIQHKEYKAEDRRGKVYIWNKYKGVGKEKSSPLHYADFFLQKKKLRANYPFLDHDK